MATGSLETETTPDTPTPVTTPEQNAVAEMVNSPKEPRTVRKLLLTLRGSDIYHNTMSQRSADEKKPSWNAQAEICRVDVSEGSSREANAQKATEMNAHLTTVLQGLGMNRKQLAELITAVKKPE